jgi:hypothetical protein
MKIRITLALGFPALCLSLALCLGGCGKSHSGASSAAALQVSNKLAAIAAAGEPTTLQALNDWYVEPPAGQNAADSYVKATEALTGDDPKSPAFLANNQKALALLYEGARQTSARYPIDLTQGAETKLPHLARIKQCISLLQSEAISQAGRGRMDDAARAIVAGLRVSRSLEQEPILISRLVEFSGLAITLQGMEQALSRHAFTDSGLVSIQTALRDAESAASMERPYIAERCFIISHFQTPPEELVKAVGLGSSGQSAPEAVKLAKYVKSPAFQEDFSFALDSLSNMIAVTRMPFPDCLDAPAANTAAEPSPDYIFSRMLLPALGKSQSRAARTAADIRIARTVIAIERYRLKHPQALPDSLNALVPQFLDAVPGDPFDGQPLRYQRNPAAGYRVYSVGLNRTDDHGSTAPTSAQDSAPLDIVVTVDR